MAVHYKLTATIQCAECPRLITIPAIRLHDTDNPYGVRHAIDLQMAVARVTASMEGWVQRDGKASCPRCTHPANNPPSSRAHTAATCCKTETILICDHCGRWVKTSILNIKAAAHAPDNQTLEDAAYATAREQGWASDSMGVTCPVCQAKQDKETMQPTLTGALAA